MEILHIPRAWRFTRVSKMNTRPNIRVTCVVQAAQESLVKMVVGVCRMHGVMCVDVVWAMQETSANTVKLWV
jgi:hypothetical protein